MKKSPLWTYIVALGVILAFILAFQWNPAFHGGGDNAVYMNMGRAIYEGKGLVQLHTAGTPPDYHIAPGYPALLAGLMAIAGNVKAVIVFKIFSAACYWCFLLIFAIILVKYLKLGFPAAAGIALFLALNPTMTVFWSAALTEAPFLLFSTAAILCLFGYVKRDNWALLILAALLTVFSVYIRLAGISFAVAAIVWLLSARKFKATPVFAGITALVLLPWVLYVLLNGEFAYVGQSGVAAIGVSGVFERVLSHAREYLFVHLPVILLPSFSLTPTLRIIVGLAAVLLFIAGFIATLRERESRFLPILVLCFVPSYLVFHFTGIRYLGLLGAPIIYTLIRGVILFLKKLVRAEKTRKIPSLILLTLFVGAVIPSFAESVAYSSHYREKWEKGGKRVDAVIPLTEEAGGFYEALAWVAENTSDDAVLISAELRIAYFVSDRQGIYIGFAEGDDIWRKALKYDATHIILDPTSAVIAAKVFPAMKSRPDCFRPVFITDKPSSVVFEIDTTRLKEELE